MNASDSYSQTLTDFRAWLEFLRQQENELMQQMERLRRKRSGEDAAAEAVTTALPQGEDPQGQEGNRVPEPKEEDAPWL